MVQEAMGGNPRSKCQFVVPKKNRPCRMFALSGEKFCGEHIVLDTEAASRQNSIPDQVRIKCPLDPSHTCFLKKLQKHLKVCNAREKERPPYFVHDINAGDNVPQPGGQTIHQLSDQALLQLIDKITSLHAEHVSEPEAAEQSSHAALADSLQNPEYGADTRKHLRQNSALLAVLRDAGLLEGDGTFVELGSGKAQLSFWLARTISRHSQIVLVDFASHRHKAENKLKEMADMPDVQRLKLDIRHLRLAGCDACRGRPVVAISKHLCGAATDLGIRAAMAETVVPSFGQSPGERPDGTPPDVRAVMIAVCCHHRVDWPSYVGKQFLQEVCHFSAADFAALKGVAAWATCGTPSWDSDQPRRSGPGEEGPRPTGTSTGNGDAPHTEPAGQRTEPGPESSIADLQKRPAAAAEHDDSKRRRLDDRPPPGEGTNVGRYQRLGLTPECRTAAGLRCKRLLDEGRRRYLQQRGYTARMVRYVPAAVSPENVLLLATR